MHACTRAYSMQARRHIGMQACRHTGVHARRQQAAGRKQPSAASRQVFDVRLQAFSGGRHACRLGHAMPGHARKCQAMQEGHAGRQAGRHAGRRAGRQQERGTARNSQEPGARSSRQPAPSSQHALTSQNDQGIHRSPSLLVDGQLSLPGALLLCRCGQAPALTAASAVMEEGKQGGTEIREGWQEAGGMHCSIYHLGCFMYSIFFFCVRYYDAMYNMMISIYTTT